MDKLSRFLSLLASGKRGGKIDSLSEFEIVSSSLSSDDSSSHLMQKKVINFDGFAIYEQKYLAVDEKTSKQFYKQCHSLFFGTKEGSSFEKGGKETDDKGALCFESVSVALVLLNPDLQTVWNFRKSLLSSAYDDEDVRYEMKICKLCLNRKPKNRIVFSHCSFILKKYLQDLFDSDKMSKSDNRLSFFEVELQDLMGLCTKWASSKFNNYTCWDFRRQLSTFASHFYSHFQLNDHKMRLVCLEELNATQCYLRTAVCDSSAWNYRIFIIEKMVNLVKSLDEIIQIVVEEFQCVQSLSSLIDYASLTHLYHRWNLIEMIVSSEEKEQLESLDAEIYFSYKRKTFELILEPQLSSIASMKEELAAKECMLDTQTDAYPSAELKVCQSSPFFRLLNRFESYLVQLCCAHSGN